MPKRKRTAARTTQIVVRQPPAQRPLVVAQRASVGRRRRGGGGLRSSLFSGGGGGVRSIIPVREAIQGGGGGILAGLIDDVLPAKWAISKTGRAALVFGATAVLAWGVGLPPLVIAGAAGGVSRKLYDDMTTGT